MIFPIGACCPALPPTPKEREKITSLARIGANIGLFVVTAAVPFITQLGKMSDMYFILAVGICTVFIACQLLVVIGVQEKKKRNYRRGKPHLAY